MEKMQENKEALIERLLKERVGNGDVASSVIVDCCGGGDCGCGSIHDDGVN